MKRCSMLALAAVVAAGLLAASCAYYNTYYLAKKYYLKGTDGRPYVVDKQNVQAGANFRKAIDYSKKVIAQYPKSKWVDDAYLLWARALLGNEDPRETTRMLEEFTTRYPESPITAEATFYLGLGYLESHKYAKALENLDAFLNMAPKNALVPYARLERTRTLMALQRYDEAAEAATRVMQAEGNHELQTEALKERAEALFAGKDYDAARQDFHTMGDRARSDDERFDLLLREADCLEAAREFDAELSLLRDALSHEQEPNPAPVDTARSTGVRVTQTVIGGPMNTGERYGRLTMRIGTAHMLQGRLDEAVAAYQRVVDDYPRSQLAAEAQYRIGYAYETVGDDFDRARAEYQRVHDLGGQTAFGTQAAQRLANLDRIAQFRTAGGDTVAKRAEAGFLVAEQYLLQLDKPERALQEYRKIADEFDGTPHAAKALTAEAWVLSRKLHRQDEADSLLWVVIHQYPRTEAQLAARDYLEEEGVTVPPELIQPPEKPEPEIVAPEDSTTQAPPAQAVLPPSGPGSVSDMERVQAMRGAVFGTGPGSQSSRTPSGPEAEQGVAAMRDSAAAREAATRDSAATHEAAMRNAAAGTAPGDSASARTAPYTTRAVAPDTSRTVAPDTTRAAAPDTTHAAASDTTHAAASDTTRAAAPDTTHTAAPRDTAAATAPDTMKAGR